MFTIQVPIWLSIIEFIKIGFINVNFRWNPKQLWGFLWITNQYDPQENSMQRLCNQYYDVHEK